MRPTPFLMVAVILAAGVALAGCQSGGTGATGGPARSDATADSPAREVPSQSVAFEPITGIPDDRAGALAAELAAVAVDRGIDVVPREEMGATYRVKGYFTAAAAGSRTAVTYVWDVFATSGARAHRITGTESVDATLPDPWQAVTDETLATIGRKTSDALADWLASVQADAGDETEEAGRETSRVPAPAPSSATGFTASRAADPLTTGSASPRRPSLPRAPGFTYYIGAVNGATSDGAVALPVALAAELDAGGGARVARPDDADYLIAGEAAVNPARSGRHDVALVWTISPRGGEPLGTVRQVSRIDENRLSLGWGASADHAAAAAAPGLLTLMLDR